MDFTKTILEGIKYWVDKKFVNIEKELVGKQPAGDYALKSDIPEINYPVTSVNGQTGDVVIDIPEVPEQVQADWNQNDETTLDYIKNRTHYTENIYELLREGEFKERESVYAFDIMKPLGRNIVYRITLGDKYCYDAYGWESDEYSCTLSLVPYEGHHGLTLYYEECSEVNNDMLFINKEVLESAGLDSYYIKIETKIDENVYQLDEKYIPDTIARASDIPSLDGFATKEYVDAPKMEFILKSSTEGSTKEFKITIDDDGVLTATEIVKTT